MMKHQNETKEKDKETLSGFEDAPDADAAAREPDASAAKKPAAKTKASKSDNTDTIHKLEEQLKEAQAQLDESMSARKRMQAEFENYKRRRETERADFEKNALRSVLLNFVEVDENMERALSGSAVESVDAYKEGVQLIVEQFRSLLKKYGVARYDSLNEPFDPNMHEAMMLCEEGKFDVDTVVQVLREGYMLHDRVLRLAGVKVAKASESDA